MGIPASSRLRKPDEFREVRRLGQRIHCRSFIFQCRMAVEKRAPRLGVIAGRRVGNAVKRGYGKRIFREIFRKHMPELPEGSECIIVLRSRFNQDSFEQLEAEFLQACKRFRNHENRK